MAARLRRGEFLRARAAEATPLPAGAGLLQGRAAAATFPPATAALPQVTAALLRVKAAAAPTLPPATVGLLPATVGLLPARARAGLPATTTIRARATRPGAATRRPATAALLPARARLLRATAQAGLLPATSTTRARAASRHRRAARRTPRQDSVEDRPPTMTAAAVLRAVRATTRRSPGNERPCSHAQPRRSHALARPLRRALRVHARARPPAL